MSSEKGLTRSANPLWRKYMKALQRRKKHREARVTPVAKQKQFSDKSKALDPVQRTAETLRKEQRPLPSNRLRLLRQSGDKPRFRLASR